MKGKIIKNMNPNFYNGEQMFRIIYKGDRWECSIKVPERDMDEFMDDVYSQYLKEKSKKVIITPEEEAEQDKDEQERLSGYFKTKTYNNFPTDEALEFDVKVRERD